MSKLTELIDSINDENISEVKEKLKAEINAENDKNRQLYSRAKKAEGFEYDKEKKEWKKAEKPSKKEPDSNKNNTEPDYAKLALLNSLEIKHPDDQKKILEESERLKMPLTDVLEMEHMKSALKDAKSQREATENAPDGKGSHNGKTANDVDYWINKGELPKDQELAQKVVKAKMDQESKNNTFSDDLY